MKLRKIGPNILLVLIALAIFFAGCEIATRLYYYIAYEQWRGADSMRMPENKHLICYDEKLGWAPPKNYRHSSIAWDSAGEPYAADIRTNEYGFRVFGDVASSKKKILFIGDSYTAAASISGGKTYYGIIGETLPAEVFAYGGGGYGTLQEYMILDRYMDLIKPDIVIWQFCSNDLVNNDYELELNSGFNNNPIRRPYLAADGTIYYDIPIRNKMLGRIKESMDRRLYFARSVFYRLNRFAASRNIGFRKKTPTSEEVIVSKGRKNPAFKRSLETTSRLMGMVRKRCAHIKILAFCVHEAKPYKEEFKGICRQNGIDYIDSACATLKKIEASGITVTVDASHWNECGHRAVAEKIIEYMKRNNLI
jgi:hypothetical protein